MKKYLALVLAAAMAVSAFAAPANAAVKLVGGDSSGKGAAAELLGLDIAKRVAELSGGEMELEYHPNGEIGDDATMLREVQDGGLDIVICQTAPVVGFIPEMAVFDLPMSFAKYDGDAIDAVLNGDNDFHTALAEAYENVDFHLLGFLQNATYRLTTSNKPLPDLASFAGLKIRTMQNANHMAFWTALGAEPVARQWSEVYFALQTGDFDAQENAADTCVGANLNEVQKYLCATNHILYCNQVAINKEAYDSLTDEQKAVLNQAVSEAIAELRPQLAQIDADNKVKLQEAGMEYIEYPAEFYDEVLAQEAVQKVYADINEQTAGLADLLVAALGE